MLEKGIHRRQTVQAHRVCDEHKNLLSITFYDEVLIYSTTREPHLKSAREYGNTVAWSANLYMIEEARLSGPDKSSDIFENGNRIIRKRSNRTNVDENNNNTSITHQ